MTYYKVLKRADDGTLRSCHGGDCVWPEPREGEPGDWLPPRRPRLCESGYHLTSSPARWWHSRAECYLVEYAGSMDGGQEGQDTIAVERARLVRRLSDAELADLQIFVSGSHVVRSGVACASGSARVHASGSARVHASGSARVHASGSARVVAYDDARVVAYDDARVEASGSASVRASGSARVEAYDYARVVATEDASVELYEDASRVEVRDAS